MVVAVLLSVGVSLAICSTAVLTLVSRDRSLRRRSGSIPVRLLLPGGERWWRGHGTWSSDVFSWRGCPAVWRRRVLRVTDVRTHTADIGERARVGRVGATPVIAELTTASGTVQVTGAAVHGAALRGPFASAGPTTRDGLR
jgi:hypothetical protein